MKLKLLKKIGNINPRDLHKNANTETNRELDARFREEIIQEIGVLPDEELSKGAYKNETCDICKQKGCDYRVKFYKEFFHKKCYDLLVEKAIMHTVNKKQ